MYSGTDFFKGQLYTDSGGSTGNYTKNESGTLVLCARPGETIEISFEDFDLSANDCAALTISGDQNGGDETYGCGIGGNSPSGIFSSSLGGCLTFSFSSTGFSSNSSVYQGWSARIIQAAFPIPTLSQWGIIILGLGLFVFSILAIRKKQPTIVKG